MGRLTAIRLKNTDTFPFTVHEVKPGKYEIRRDGKGITLWMTEQETRTAIDYLRMGWDARVKQERAKQQETRDGLQQLQEQTATGRPDQERLPGV